MIPIARQPSSPLARLVLGLVALASTSLHAVAQQPYEACGMLVSDPPFCPLAFQPDNAAGIVLLIDYGGFPAGTRVHVIGSLQSCSTSCQTGTCVFGNTIELCAPCGCSSYCAGDGTSMPCPCTNSGVPGFGCPNSVAPSGAEVAVTGGSSLAQDTIVFYAWSMPNDLAIYLQGTGSIDVPFGDGKRCVGGSLVRLGVRTNVLGSSKFPYVGEERVAARGGVTAPGTRYYQVWYRDAAAYCTSATFNVTNAIRIDWQP